MAKPREVLVGAVFIIALIILGAFTVVIGNFRWPWAERMTLRARFENIEGLKEGDEVRLRGMQIGRVTALDETDGGDAIIVTLELDKEVRLYAPNKETGARGYLIQVRNVSPLGGRFVSIFPGDERGTPITLSEDEVLAGTAVGDLLAGAADVLAQLHDILDKIERGEGAIGALVHDEKIADDLRSAVQSIKSVAADLEAGKGTIGKLLRDPEMADQLAAALQSIRTVAANIEQGKGTLGKLATDEALYNDVADAAGSLKTIAADIREGKGTIGRLYKDDTLYNNVADAAAGLGGLGRSITESKGVLGQLVNDPQLADDVRATVAGLRSAIASISEGQGTLGMLIKDKAVYEKLDQLLTGVNDMVQDMREQAPVSLFTGLLTLGL